MLYPSVDVFVAGYIVFIQAVTLLYLDKLEYTVANISYLVLHLLRYVHMLTSDFLRRLFVKSNGSYTTDDYPML